MNYNIPTPQEDELALGMLGRFARLNGMSSISWAISALKNSFAESTDTPVLWAFAKACGADSAGFVFRHSMLPVLYPISRYIGSPQAISSERHLAQIAGLTTSLATLRWCPDCVFDDKAERGFSHWRRQHQISGQDVCSVHQTHLREVPIEAAIHQPCLRHTEDDHTKQLIDLRVELINPTLERMRQIQFAWLRRQHPYHVRAWSEVITQRCLELKLRRSEVGKRPVTSDLMHELFPMPWLHRHMPEVATKQPNAFVKKVDGACIDRHVSYPSLTCAAILAALFESTDQALTALDIANHRLLSTIGTDASTENALTAFKNGAGLHNACKNHGANIACVESELRDIYRLKSTT